MDEGSRWLGSFLGGEGTGVLATGFLFKCLIVIGFTWFGLGLFEIM